MKRLITVCVFLLQFFGSAGFLHADLIPIGDGTIYDDDIGVYWLEDANYIFTSGYAAANTKWGDGQTTWSEATTWIDFLNTTSYLGHNNWRLPISDLCYGYNCSDSELGHLYHIEGITSASQTPFINIDRQRPYWTMTELPNDPTTVMYLQFNDGYQNDVSKAYDNGFAWAVRDGPAPIPEPATIILLGSGLIGLAGWKRRKYKKN